MGEASIEYQDGADFALRQIRRKVLVKCLIGQAWVSFIRFRVGPEININTELKRVQLIQCVLVYQFCVYHLFLLTRFMGRIACEELHEH